jgi:hypothetical protein
VQFPSNIYFEIYQAQKHDMLNANGRAMEMFESGEGFDCVIEVEPNDGHGQGKVSILFLLIDKSVPNLATDFGKINTAERLILPIVLQAEKVD